MRPIREYTLFGKRIGSAVMVLACLSGCMGTAGLEGLRAELDEVQAAHAELRSELEALRQQQTGAAEEMKALERRVREESGRVDVLVERLSLNAATPPGTGAPAGSRRRPLPSFEPEVMWREADQAAQTGRYAESILRLEELVALHPRHDLADDARLRIGDAYFDQGDYTRAVEQYVKVVTEYPESERLPAAAMKAALSYEQLGDMDSARAIYGELRSRYPDSTEAGEAAARLQELERKDDVENH